jgi:hypothetical protein
MARAARPSLIADLKLVEARGAAAEVAMAPAEGSKRKPRPDIVHTSVYLPQAVYQRLRAIAYERDCKIHDLMMEGIDAALQKHGHPGVEVLKRGNSAA